VLSAVGVVFDAALLIRVAFALGRAVLAGKLASRADLGVAERHEGEIHDLGYALSIESVIEV
jgi:hypothetical protein